MAYSISRTMCMQYPIPDALLPMISAIQRWGYGWAAITHVGMPLVGIRGVGRMTALD